MSLVLTDKTQSNWDDIHNHEFKFNKLLSKWFRISHPSFFDFTLHYRCFCFCCVYILTDLGSTHSSAYQWSLCWRPLFSEAHPHSAVWQSLHSHFASSPQTHLKNKTTIVVKVKRERQSKPLYELSEIEGIGLCWCVIQLHCGKHLKLHWTLTNCENHVTEQYSFTCLFNNFDKVSKKDNNETKLNTDFAENMLYCNVYQVSIL